MWISFKWNEKFFQEKKGKLTKIKNNLTQKYLLKKKGIKTARIGEKDVWDIRLNQKEMNKVYWKRFF